MASRIEQIAALAMKLGLQHLEPYGAVTSRHDFTQRQLMTCLVLKAYLKTTYRGVVDFLEGHAGLRRVLGMEGKLPHYTSLQKFSARDGGVTDRGTADCPHWASLAAPTGSEGGGGAR